MMQVKAFFLVVTRPAVSCERAPGVSLCRNCVDTRDLCFNLTYARLLRAAGVRSSDPRSRPEPEPGLQAAAQGVAQVSLGPSCGAQQEDEAVSPVP